MRIELPELSLIALVGTSSSGKSTFAAKHFRDTEILSSDHYRAVICDDENDQSVTAEAFDLLYYAAGKRLACGKRTVIDATNLYAADRKKILELAKAHDVHAAAIVLDMDEKEILRRNALREDRSISEKALRSQLEAQKKSVRNLKKEGFRFVFSLKGKDIPEAEIVYTKLWSDKTELHGPFDIIGDVHGCVDELVELLEKLGYEKNPDGVYMHKDARTAVFLGDLIDRGPGNVAVLKLVMGMSKAGSALCIPGNHENKLGRYLNHRNVQVTHGLEITIRELEREGEDFQEAVRRFIDGLVSHYRLDDGKLVVAHAGIKQEYIGRASARIREFCLYGDTTGETDDLGRPIRLDWAENYRGKPIIVYGHVPRQEVYTLNNTWCIDTGCVFGGSLTCFRYPEKEIVSVQAKQEYYTPVSPLEKKETRDADALLASDVNGKLYIETDLLHSVTIREEQSAAAMEIMSRFAVEPHWLIYLPPTMSPCETAALEDYLEYPAEAFSYFAKNKIDKVVCEKKHMGSRAVIVLCRNEETAQKRFGIHTGETGVIYSRTGRRFFQDPEVKKALLDRLCVALSENGFWEDFQTEWVCLDAEIMPWSEKALSLIRTQYGPIGTAGRISLDKEIDCIRKAVERSGDNGSDSGLDLNELLSEYENKKSAIDGYVKAYREYCWEVRSVDDLSVAPFHLLAAEGRVFTDKDHVWHMNQLKKYCTGDDKVFVATEHIVVDVNDEGSVKNGIQWWLDLTAGGGEGMVVKPFNFVARCGDKLIQPAVKCRGREYLRIIYGPEYLFPKYLSRLKNRSLSMKRNLALKEFALGIEALERFVKREPLNRIHQCVFGVLALESEPVDPRL